MEGGEYLSVPGALYLKGEKLLITEDAEDEINEKKA